MLPLREERMKATATAPTAVKKPPAMRCDVSYVAHTETRREARLCTQTEGILSMAVHKRH